jgi:antitoxin (DNA-binding transcriptional repressor) of toxin-antitoxin stability system
MAAGAFKATCLAMMDDIAATHGHVVVTKHGRPVVTIGPARALAPSPFGFLRNTLVADHGLVAAEHEAWTLSSTDPLERGVK